MKRGDEALVQRADAPLPFKASDLMGGTGLAYAQRRPPVTKESQTKRGKR